jgi:hypothetical protein
MARNEEEFAMTPTAPTTPPAVPSPEDAGGVGITRPVPRVNPYLYFLVANLIAIAVGGAIYVFFLRADFLDGPMFWMNRFLFEYKGLAVIAATSPLFCGLLVGLGYANRARKRREAQARAATALDEESAGLPA